MRPMKLAVILAVAMILGGAATSRAGSVQVGLLNVEEFDKWNCGEPVPSESRSNARCGDATFDQTSNCDTVVITNDSNHRVNVELQVTGPGFEQPPPRQLGFGFFDFGPSSCKQRIVDTHCESLEPGHSCYQAVEFWPEGSGTSEGRVEVRVTGSSAAPLTRSYSLVATATYTPELAAADAVRKDYRDELMRIPHVVRVSLDNSSGEIVINVEVAHAEDIPKVQRSAPPRLGGYRVEVIEKIERAWAM